MKLFSFYPVAQIGNQQYLRLTSIDRIALVQQPLCKAVDLDRQWTMIRMLKCLWI